MEEKYRIKSPETPNYNYWLAIKALLIAIFIIVGCVAVLDFFFIEKLAAPEIDQVYASGETASIIVSEFALGSMYSGKQEYVKNALNRFFEKSEHLSEHILQISVILVSNGVYYASTNRGFQNKKVHPSLLQQINSNDIDGISIKKVNYRIDDKVITVLQFLSNIVVEKSGEKVRIATTQVLFNYNSIIEKTRYRLFVLGLLNAVIIFLIIWIVFSPISRGHRRLIEALKQVKKNNLDYRLLPTSKDEIGVLYVVYNEMIESLKSTLVSKYKTSSNVLEDYFKSSSKKTSDLALRKFDIICLCARIPGIQTHIEDEESDSISAYVDNSLNTIKKSIQMNGGQAVKIIGDKIFFLFEGINGVDNAVRAALKCRLIWLQLNHERKVHEKSLLNFGIGLHSAVGVAGKVADASENFTFVGEAASIADYLCTCAKREEVLITASMIEKANESYQHETATTHIPDHMSNEEALLLTDGTLEESLTIHYNGADFEQRQRNQDYHSDPNTEFRSLTKNRSYDSSIPDILEETLSATPLDLVKDNAGDNSSLAQIVNEETFQDGGTGAFERFPVDENEQDPGTSKSLWDKVNSEISTQKE